MLKFRLATDIRRAEPTATEPVWGPGFGLEAAAGFGVAYHLWLVAIRMVSGPEALELVGMDSWELARVYMVGLGVAGVSCDLLEGRFGLLGSLVSWSAMTFAMGAPMMVNLGLSLGQVPPPLFGMTGWLISFAAMGGLLGVMTWQLEREVERARQGRLLPAETGESPERVRDSVGRRYEVLAELERGPGGAAYLALDRKSKRRVAIKVLPMRATLSDHVSQAARMPPHPNIVSIVDVKQVGAFVHVVMDYVEGETLGQRVRRAGPLAVGDATRLMYDVARALARAHREHVSHGSLSPETIVIDSRTGRAMVTDWGIACPEVGGDVGPTVCRASRAPFRSPEDLAGQRMEERRNDVYAFGVTAYYAVTGYLPFEGASVEEVLAQHLVEPEPRLPVYNRYGDVTYSEVSGMCLKRDPAVRFQTGNDVVEALGRAPELRRNLPWDLAWFPRTVWWQVESAAGSGLVAAGAVLAIVFGAAAGERVGVTAGGAILLWMAADWWFFVVLDARSLLAQGFGRADILHAFVVELEREREFAGSIENRTSPVRTLEWWISFLQGRAGEWSLGLMGLGLKRSERDAPEIAMLRAPSYEAARFEAKRDLLNRNSVWAQRRRETEGGEGR